MLPLKNDFCYAILDDRGMAQPGAAAAAGLYRHDTRHLSRYVWSFGDLVLIHQQVTGRSLTQFWSRMVDHAQEVLLERRLELQPAGLVESFCVDNSSAEAAEVIFALDCAADFVDIFEARGHKRCAPANLVEDERGAQLRRFRYVAQDGVVSATGITGLVDKGVLELAPRETLRFRVETTFETSLPAASAAPGSAPLWRPDLTRLRPAPAESGGLAQAIADIESLLFVTPQGRTIAAGIPNFVAPFGRDSLITAWLLLDVDPGLARSVLAHLGAHQGTKIDPLRDEEPGKILHEHRECELSRIGELPFRTYYGSADSTPLFLMLLGDYVARTGDIAFAREIEPNWRAALRWIEQYSDARGLINFRQRADGQGLTVQSWKDSGDSMSYADGRLGDGSLAVAEVQGYAYAAFLAGAELSILTGGSAAEQLRLQALAQGLAVRFDALYWMPQHSNYAMALDQQGRQLDVNASNSGHLLWSGIVPREKAAAVIARLFAEDLWSGYGLRTLSSREKRYNPLSYHNGSVWPHDTAIFAAGLKRYGDESGFERVREGLVALARFSPDLRLPELVGGYPRDGGIPPLPYVESCRPQAWSAAALIYALGPAEIGILEPAQGE